MIAGLDSSADRPSAATADDARATGVGLWSGYVQTHSGVGLYSAWDLPSFDNARRCGGKPIAFSSGWDDPVAVAQLAASWNVRLCLDVESGIRGDGPWVDGWLAQSGAGLYGNASVHFETGQPVGRGAAFNIVSGYFGYDPGTTWEPWLTDVGERPAAPCGWQWEGGHSEFGLDVDRGWYDDWFGGNDVSVDDVRAALNEGTVFGTSSWAETNVNMARGIQELHNMVADLTANVGAAKAELDATKAELDKVAASAAPGMDLSQVYSRLDALGKHLGVGTP